MPQLTFARASVTLHSVQTQNADRLMRAECVLVGVRVAG
jgi:hypothetical protein